MLSTLGAIFETEPKQTYVKLFVEIDSFLSCLYSVYLVSASFCIINPLDYCWRLEAPDKCNAIDDNCDKEVLDQT